MRSPEGPIGAPTASPNTVKGYASLESQRVMKPSCLQQLGSRGRCSALLRAPVRGWGRSGDTETYEFRGELGAGVLGWRRADRELDAYDATLPRSVTVVLHPRRG